MGQVSASKNRHRMLGVGMSMHRFCFSGAQLGLSGAVHRMVSVCLFSDVRIALCWSL